MSPYPLLLLLLHLKTQTQSASNDCFIDEARVHSLTQACNIHRPNQLQSGGEEPERWLEEDPGNIYCKLNNGKLGCWLKNECRSGAIWAITLIMSHRDETDAVKHPTDFSLPRRLRGEHLHGCVPLALAVVAFTSVRAVHSTTHLLRFLSPRSSDQNLLSPSLRTQTRPWGFAGLDERGNNKHWLFIPDRLPTPPWPFKEGAGRRRIIESSLAKKKKKNSQKH